MHFLFFCFSIRGRHTICALVTWSSDVCSSDLQVHVEAQVLEVKLNKTLEYGVSWFFGNQVPGTNLGLSQSLNDFSNVGSVISSAANSSSAERREGKECVSPCRSRWSTYH